MRCDVVCTTTKHTAVRNSCHQALSLERRLNGGTAGDGTCWGEKRKDLKPHHTVPESYGTQANNPIRGSKISIWPRGSGFRPVSLQVHWSDRSAIHGVVRPASDQDGPRKSCESPHSGTASRSRRIPGNVFGSSIKAERFAELRRPTSYNKKPPRNHWELRIPFHASA
jgi:hypothetical protein